MSLCWNFIPMSLSGNQIPTKRRGNEIPTNRSSELYTIYNSAFRPAGSEEAIAVHNQDLEIGGG